MRFWVKDSERRPDPRPTPTDDRTPMLVGLAAWLLALAAVILAPPVLGAQLPATWLWSCIAGLVLGSLGLAYVQRGHGG